MCSHAVAILTVFLILQPLIGPELSGLIAATDGHRTFRPLPFALQLAELLHLALKRLSRNTFATFPEIAFAQL